LFGNANDVGKMMQMYLNGGWYGDQQLIKQSTLDLFNTRPYKNNRRVLGFDKPPLKGTRGSMGSLASEESYGHTGFTGTLVWVDPKYNFVYVFLSNRIYPDIENEKINSMGIRGKVHNEFYKAIINGQKNKAL
jgi:CubicO group peptidase (beta-lactamase class C family)